MGCQILRRGALEKKEFVPVAKKVVLFYNVFNDINGRELLSIYKVKAFPTIKFLDKNGKELFSIAGAITDISFFSYCIDTLNKGITEKNLKDYFAKGKITLKDVYDFAQMYSYKSSHKTLNLLVEIIDNYSGEGNKDLAKLIYFSTDLVKKMLDSKNTDKEKLKELWDKKLVLYSRKLDKKFRPLIKLQWFFVKQELPKEKNLAFEILENFDRALLIKDFPEAFSEACNIIYIYQQEKAYSLIFPPTSEENIEQKFFFSFLTDTGILAYKFKANGLSERVGNTLLEVLKKIKTESPDEFPMYFFSVQHYMEVTRFPADALVPVVISYNKANSDYVYLLSYKMVELFLNLGEKNKALDFVKNYIDTPEMKKGLGNRFYAFLLKTVCDIFLKKGISNNYLISLMQQSVDIMKTHWGYHTLARLYALNGEYEKAIKTNEKGLKLLKKFKHSSKEDYDEILNAIDEWKKKLEKVS